MRHEAVFHLWFGPSGISCLPGHRRGPRDFARYTRPVLVELDHVPPTSSPAPLSWLQPYVCLRLPFGNVDSTTPIWPRSRYNHPKTHNSSAQDHTKAKLIPILKGDGSLLFNTKSAWFICMMRYAWCHLTCTRGDRRGKGKFHTNKQVEGMGDRQTDRQTDRDSGRERGG